LNERRRGNNSRDKQAYQIETLDQLQSERKISRVKFDIPYEESPHKSVLGSDTNSNSKFQLSKISPNINKPRENSKYEKEMKKYKKRKKIIEGCKK